MHQAGGKKLLSVKQNANAITAPTVAESLEVIVPSLGNAGMNNWVMSDITGVDVSIGAQDEDISFMGLRNVGKIEVKKDTSVTITRKKSDAGHTLLFQGKTNSDVSNTSDGNHSARYGLIANPTSEWMAIADGTVDPKSTKGDMGSGSNQAFGYRVFVELKAASSTTAGDGEVLVIPNCHFMEYGHTLSNESANEETFGLSSQVKPFIWNGTKAGTADTHAYNGKAVLCTLASLL
jgi:hypothetical protein